MLSDLRQALGSLAHAPGLAVGAVVLLGVGLGVGLTLFNAVQALLWRGLPFPDAARLVTVEVGDPGRGLFPPVSRLMARRLAETPGVAAVGLTGNGGDLELAEGAGPERLSLAFVNGDYFRALGLRARLGRLFEAEEDRGAVETGVVLTERAWRRHFGGDATLVGRQLATPKGPVRVLGVLAGEATLPWLKPETEVLQPIPWRKADAERDRWFIHKLVVRLTPDLDPAEGRARIRQSLEASQEAWWPGGPLQLRARPLRDLLAPKDRGIYLNLLGLAGLLVLLVCVNVAGLFLARAQARSREEALRAALGGSLGAALRRHALEAYLVSGAGMALALTLEWAARPLVLAQLPELTTLGPELLRTGPGLLATAAALVLATTVGLALLPALHARSLDLAPSLAQEGTAGMTARRGPWPALLVGSQTALVLVLLAASALLGRSLAKAIQEDPGFPNRGLLCATLKAPRGVPAGPWAEEVRTRALGLAGVRAAGLCGTRPFGTSASVGAKGPGGTFDLGIQMVRPGTLETLGVPILAGRLFGPGDAKTGVVLNRTAARRLFGDEPAVGRTYDSKAVLGVVGDVRLEGLDLEAPPLEYSQDSLTAFGGPYLLVRTELRPETFQRLLKARLDSGRVEKVASVHAMALATVEHRRRLPLVAAVFSLAGLLLATTGLWASLRAALRQRRRELGMRAALGGAPTHLAIHVLWRALAPVGLGVLVGLPLAVATGRLVQHQLYGVSPADPLALLAGTALLTATAFLAALLPALRAARVQPAEALRSE